MDDYCSYNDIQNKCLSVIGSPAAMPETFIIHDSDSWLSSMNRVALPNVNRAYDGDECVVIDQSIGKTGVGVG